MLPAGASREAETTNFLPITSVHIVLHPAPSLHVLNVEGGGGRVPAKLFVYLATYTGTGRSSYLSSWVSIPCYPPRSGFCGVTQHGKAFTGISDLDFLGNIWKGSLPTYPTH